LALHLAAGTQLTLVIRTLVTCKLVLPLCFVVFVLAAGALAAGELGAGALALAPPGETTPALLAASARGTAIEAEAQSAIAANVAARSTTPLPDRLWTAVIANLIPFHGGPARRARLGGVRD
jgi:hypothetical protein